MKEKTDLVKKRGKKLNEHRLKEESFTQSSEEEGANEPFIVTCEMLSDAPGHCCYSQKRNYGTSFRLRRSCWSPCSVPGSLVRRCRQTYLESFFAVGNWPHGTRNSCPSQVPWRFTRKCCTAVQHPCVSMSSHVFWHKRWWGHFWVHLKSTFLGGPLSGLGKSNSDESRFSSSGFFFGKIMQPFWGGELSVLKLLPF